MVAKNLLSLLFACTAAALPSNNPTAASLDVRQNPIPSGFVTRQGREFVMDSEPFYFAGTNAYWANAIADSDVESLMSQLKDYGLKVLRIFGWCDDTTGPESYCMQYWNGTVNHPYPEAFKLHIDPIVKYAEQYGIKLVVPMMGNWGPSISLYVEQFYGPTGNHSDFFTDPRIIAAYKKYVKFFVTRYRNSPAIFAWELMNEPRCGGDSELGTSTSCTDATLTSWISEMSAYIKAVDEVHMVTVGDEGWFTTNQGYGDSYPYQGNIASSELGIDWVTNLKIDTIDYGTVHLYPDSWGQTYEWGNTWIEQHAAQAKAIGKPVVLEEFGIPNLTVIKAGGETVRYEYVKAWLNSTRQTGYAGIQYWQYVATFPDGFMSPNDGNGINVTEPTFKLVESYAEAMNLKSGPAAGRR